MKDNGLPPDAVVALVDAREDLRADEVEKILTASAMLRAMEP